MTPKQKLVLQELEALDKHHRHMSTRDGHWRPFHVRYFRGQASFASGMAIEAVAQLLRELARAPEVLAHRRLDVRQPSYMINDAGRAALEEREEYAEKMASLDVNDDEVTRRRMVELSIPAGATKKVLVARIGEEMAEGDRLRRQVERLQDDVHRLEQEK